MQEADPSHSFGLLRAAEECDEFAPSHAKLPVEDEAYQRAELCITAKFCRRWQRWVIFDWDEASGRSHHVAYAPESDLIAASPRNDATGHQRKSAVTRLIPSAENYPALTAALSTGFEWKNELELGSTFSV